MKCFRYWPNDHNDILKFENIEVKLLSIEITSEYTIREIELKVVSSEFFDENNNESFLKSHSGSLRFTQIHMTNWPDHGVPENCDSIIDIIRLIKKNYPAEMRQSQVAKVDPTSYLAVHCSAGCGRTGTLIAIDYCYNLIYSNRLSPDTFHPLDIARTLRSQRIAMIQTIVSSKIRRITNF